MIRALAVAALAALLVVACGRKDPQAPPAGASASAAASAPAAETVRLLVPERVRFTPRVEATGVL
jgi:hypothetical protein